MYTIFMASKWCPYGGQVPKMFSNSTLGHHVDALKILCTSGWQHPISFEEDVKFNCEKMGDFIIKI